MQDRTQSRALKELDPLIGLTISGRYRVHTLLGQGGMGKVFQAQQIPLGRAVALKVLEANRVDQEFHRRFFQEAAILARLQSRHTVTIYDYGRDGDIYFIAMELVSGGALDRVIAAEGPFPPRRAVSIAQQICRSLREAHAQGVIHRDLKPANVVLTRDADGEELAKVLDFGLAKRLDRATDETQTDTVPGSPKYMAPEVIRQQPFDGRADMYALGVMLYQMLTGVVPFDRPAAMDILLAHLNDAPRPFRQVNPAVSVPLALERVVMRCLAKPPDQRFANMQELLEVLSALGRELGIHTDPSPSWTGNAQSPASAPPRRNSVAPSLRVAPRDLVGPSARPGQQRRGPSRTAVWVLAFSVLLAGTILGLAFLRAGGLHGPEASAAAPPQPAPPTKEASAETPSAAAAPAEEGEPSTPDMVISTDDLKPARIPSVRVRASSDPPGASVLVRGHTLGKTPGSFVVRDKEARPGGELSFAFKLDGYETHVVRRQVDGRELTVTASLVKSPPPAHAAAPAAKPKPKEEPADTAQNDTSAEPSEDNPLDEPPPAPPPVLVVKRAVPPQPGDSASSDESEDVSDSADSEKESEDDLGDQPEEAPPPAAKPPAASKPPADLPMPNPFRN